MWCRKKIEILPPAPVGMRKHYDIAHQPDVVVTVKPWWWFFGVLMAFGVVIDILSAYMNEAEDLFTYLR